MLPNDQESRRYASLYSRLDQDQMDSQIVARYGTEAWRYLGWTPAGLRRIAQWKARAVAAGMSLDEVEALWAGVELDQMLSPVPFNAVREAERRLRSEVHGR